jgi:hypothetical protein
MYAQERSGWILWEFYFLGFIGTTILLSRVVALIYILTNSVEEFLALCSDPHPWHPHQH